MKKRFENICIVVICLCMIISLAGCKKTGSDITSSNISSENEVVSSEQETADSESDETDDFTGDEDYYQEDYFEEDFFEDDYESYISDKITVKNSIAPIENDFLGLNGVQHCYTYMYDEFGRNYTEKQAQDEFDRMKKMGVSMIRTYYDEEFAYDTKSGSWNWESDDMKAVYKWMLELQKRNIKVACNTGWSIIGAYIKDYTFSWVGTFVEGDVNTTIKNKANWMKESLNQFRAHGINNVEYLILTTEPGRLSDYDAEVLAKTNLENTDKVVTDVNVWLNYSRTLHNVLVENGTRKQYKFVGPNTTWLYETANNPTKMNPVYYFAVKYASDIIDVFSYHTYPNISDVISNSVSANMEYDIMIQDRIDMAKNKGKKFWYDETNLRAGLTDNMFDYKNDNPMESLHTASYVIDAMRRGVQNVMWWYLFDQQWPNNIASGSDYFENGMHRWGCAPSLMESYTPQQSYYGFSLLTKYLGNHSKVYKTEAEYDSFDVAVQQDKDGEWTVVITSYEIENAYFELSFEKSIGNKKFYRHVYDSSIYYPTVEAEIIPTDKILISDGNKLIDKIPPYSVVVYTTRND
ncbi:MAG: hypothetical protein J6B88_03690 [Clostridia bacterium]|nr:hypothetical protein [Clostridia bacterium]